MLLLLRLLLLRLPLLCEDSDCRVDFLLPVEGRFPRLRSFELRVFCELFSVSGPEA